MNESIDGGRFEATPSTTEMSRRYRALLIENQAPPGLIEEYYLLPLDGTEPPERDIVLTPAHPRGGAAPPGDVPCEDLVRALNDLRSRLVDRAVSHAAPGIGQESMAFFDVDAGYVDDSLRPEIERLERAVQAAGCPL